MTVRIKRCRLITPHSYHRHHPPARPLTAFYRPAYLAASGREFDHGRIKVFRGLRQRVRLRQDRATLTPPSQAAFAERGPLYIAASGREFDHGKIVQYSRHCPMPHSPNAARGTIPPRERRRSVARTDRSGSAKSWCGRAPQERRGRGRRSGTLFSALINGRAEWQLEAYSRGGGREGHWARVHRTRGTAESKAASSRRTPGRWDESQDPMASTITMTITNYEHEIRSPISDVRVTGTSLEPR